MCMNETLKAFISTFFLGPLYSAGNVVPLNQRKRFSRTKSRFLSVWEKSEVTVCLPLPHLKWGWFLSHSYLLSRTVCGALTLEDLCGRREIYSGSLWNQVYCCKNRV